MQSGVAEKGSVTDLSPGMVKVALRNAENLGLDVDGRVADAEKIPTRTTPSTWSSDTLCCTTSRMSSCRCAKSCGYLKPGGRFVFAGEPSTIGDFYARWMSRATWWATTNITSSARCSRGAVRRKSSTSPSRAAALEAVVDIHTFDPDELAGIARSAGATEVKTATEELAAAMLGWPVRTSRPLFPPTSSAGAGRDAFGGWKKMTWLDENVPQGRSPEILLQRRSYGCEARVTEGPAGLVRVCRPSSVVGVRTRIGLLLLRVAPHLQWIEVYDQPSVARFRL